MRQRTVAIIQARMGSKRLPGKVLMDLGGKPVLQWVVEAARAASGIDDVVVATDNAGTEPIRKWCKENDTHSYTLEDDGDVLLRYLAAAEVAEAAVIVRLTGDCPLVDPDVISEVIASRTAMDAAYASNVDPPSWPDGMDCECFTLEALLAADREATSAHDREHVTPWMRRNLPRRVNINNPAGDQSRVKLSIDTTEDLERVRAHIRKIEGGTETGRADDPAGRTDLFQV